MADKTNWVERARKALQKEQDEREEQLFEESLSDTDRKEAVEEKLNLLFYGDEDKVKQFSDLFVELSKQDGFEQIEELLFDAQSEIERVVKSQDSFKKQSQSDEETVIEKKDQSDEESEDHDYLNEILTKRYGE